MITPEALAWIGRVYPTKEFIVTALQIQRFAYSVGETNAIHFDAAAARAAGYPDIVAPPMFYVVLRTAPYHTVPLAMLGTDGFAAQDLPPIRSTTGVAGEDWVEWAGEIVAGDTIIVTKRLADLYAKHGRSGELAFVVFEFEMRKANGELAVRERFTRVLR